MKILAVEQPAAGSPPGPPSDALLESEARRLWQLLAHAVSLCMA